MPATVPTDGPRSFHCAGDAGAESRAPDAAGGSSRTGGGISMQLLKMVELVNDRGLRFVVVLVVLALGLAFASWGLIGVSGLLIALPVVAVVALVGLWMYLADRRKGLNTALEGQIADLQRQTAALQAQSAALQSRLDTPRISVHGLPTGAIVPCCIGTMRLVIKLF